MMCNSFRRLLTIGYACGLFSIGLTGCDFGNVAPSAAQPPAATAPQATVDAAGKEKAAPSGNAPKAVVVGGNEFHFGTTEVGQEFEHVFEVRNEGTADLHVRAGVPSCTTCTSFSLDKEIVKPGDSLFATVKWHIKSANPEFRQYAPLLLDNDEQLKLYVIGQVVKRILVEPAERWNLGDVLEAEETTLKATITSKTMDKFDIESIKTGNPELKVDYVAMSPERLEELKVKSGYDLTARLSSGIPIGEFSDQVSINVLDPKPISLKVDVGARRTGPVKILGPNWDPEFSILRLGNFDTSSEFIARLSLFTRGIDGDVKIEKVKCADPRFSFELKRDPKFNPGTGSARYELAIKVAPEMRSVVYTAQAPLEVELITNQPKIGSIKFAIRSAQLR